MTMKTSKKHRNQNKDTQDRPRLDPIASRQSGRMGNRTVQPGNQSGAGNSGGNLGGNSGGNIGGGVDDTLIGNDIGQGRGNRQQGSGGNR
jgi:hypothetical protein